MSFYVLDGPRLLRCWVDSASLRVQSTFNNVPVLQEDGLEGEEE